MLISSTAIFAFTYVLHRRRVWALTAGGPLRAFTLKYLPFSLLYGFGKFISADKMPMEELGEDFGEIQE